MSPAMEAQARDALKSQEEQEEQENLQLQPQSLVEKGVMLEPFVHQVGGHCCVLRFRDETICKPLIPREHQFYKSLPAAIRRFTPQYRGVVSVSFQEDLEGNICLFANPLDLENKDPSDLEPRTKLVKVRASSLLLDTENYKDGRRSSRKDKEKRLQEEADIKQSEVLHCRLDRTENCSAPELQHNPWSLKCHQQHLQKLRENAKLRNQYKFILLENLTWRHTVPCVLDLKMGTRQHGDDASEEKKAEHIRKCELSTSGAIGVRLGGMQVYQPDTGHLLFMDKYHGRQLSASGFKEALFQFFHSGRRLRLELLQPVLLRLRDMKATLEACDSYRFFSSSLLIIYDGLCSRQGAESAGEEEEPEEEQPEGEELYPKVDVRMIDFAHTTCRHYGHEGVVHEGQDSGYIFGLQNLIRIIAELEEHSTDYD